jgi:predicted AlkP superfamily phosphohydrolase/phosphomutase
MSGRARAALGIMRRLAPASIKRRYHRVAGAALVHRVAQQTILPPYDWSRTLAFSLPTDQHGYLRVNLAGREARGIVARHEYQAVCRRLTDLLLGLETAAGEPVVEAVVGMAEAHGGSPPEALPDLVVHWTDAACVPELRLASPPLVCRSLTAVTQTGQHAPDGFYVLRSPSRSPLNDGGTVPAEDLHRLVVAAAADPATAARD